MRRPVVSKEFVDYFCLFVKWAFPPESRRMLGMGGPRPSWLPENDHSSSRLVNDLPPLNAHQLAEPRRSGASAGSLSPAQAGGGRRWLSDQTRYQAG